jgi:hypothetical protein
MDGGSYLTWAVRAGKRGAHLPVKRSNGWLCAFGEALLTAAVGSRARGIQLLLVWFFPRPKPSPDLHRLNRGSRRRVHVFWTKALI